jgi:hypothetical protein
MRLEILEPRFLDIRYIGYANMSPFLGRPGNKVFKAIEKRPLM